MPAFPNPFQGKNEHKLTKEELIQAVRLDIAGELEAIYLYDAHVRATDNEVAKKIIADIRDEEKAHVGELMTLLKLLDPVEAELFASGEAEGHEMLSELGITASAENPSDSPSEPETVGSMIDKA